MMSAKGLILRRYMSKNSKNIKYLLFINRVRGLYCKIQSPRSAVQPELARAVRGD